MAEIQELLYEETGLVPSTTQAFCLHLWVFISAVYLESCLRQYEEDFKKLLRLAIIVGIRISLRQISQRKYTDSDSRAKTICYFNCLFISEIFLCKLG